MLYNFAFDNKYFFGLGTLIPLPMLYGALYTLLFGAPPLYP
jgi:hypothetical protein